MTIHVETSTSSSPYRRGQALGTARRIEIADTWERYERLFTAYAVPGPVVRDVADHVLENVTGWAPDLAEELVGVAAGSALEPWQVTALNARSEILARSPRTPPGECSTIVRLPPVGPPQTLQTWDWQDAMAGNLVVWTLEPRPGRTVKTLTEPGILGKIGVTDDGIGLHFNLLQHDRDGGAVGVPVHLLARRVLDEASGLDEAEQIVRSATVSASVALTVVAYDGAHSSGCVLEVSPAGVARLEPGPGRTLLHTNHFLDPVLAAGERLAGEDPDTVARLSALARRVEGFDGPSVQRRVAVLDHHREDGAALCCHPYGDDPLEGRWQTLAVVGLDLAAGQLAVHEGYACEAVEESWSTV